MQRTTCDKLLKYKLGRLIFHVCPKQRWFSSEFTQNSQQEASIQFKVL